MSYTIIGRYTTLRPKIFFVLRWLLVCVLCASGLLVLGGVLLYNPWAFSWNTFRLDQGPSALYIIDVVGDSAYQMLGYAAYVLAGFLISFGVFLGYGVKGKFLLRQGLLGFMGITAFTAYLGAFFYVPESGTVGWILQRLYRDVLPSPFQELLGYSMLGISCLSACLYFQALTFLQYVWIQLGVRSSRPPSPSTRNIARPIPPKKPTSQKNTLPVSATEESDIVQEQSDDLPSLPSIDGYVQPPLDLLSMPQFVQGATVSQEQLAQNTLALSQVLEDFGVRGQLKEAYPGPVVTLYELEPAAGIKSSRIVSLADDIARSMSALSARVAVIPGRNAIGIELPNQVREIVYLRELLSHSSYLQGTGLPLVLGKDISGKPVVADLTRMPHLLVAGTTGSGKSVGINVMILSLIYRFSPQNCRLIMIDPKMLELSVYEGIPHLLTPVVTEPKQAVNALKWAVREMENRYRAMAQLGVRNIDGYNQRLRQAQESNQSLHRTVQVGFDEEGKAVFEDQFLPDALLPYIVIIVDEMADLMLVAGKEIEAAVQRLAQMARAAGIHLIMATQRPSVDVITGTIKANFPTRISFQVTSKIDSRTILGEQGAEQLLGRGDMLYMAPGGRIIRVHGPFVGDEEVGRVVAHLKEHNVAFMNTSEGPEAILASVNDTLFDEDNSGELDDLYTQGVALIMREGKASTSYLQRYFQIGYNRAARLMEKMEKEGIVSAANAAGKRTVLRRD